MKNTEKGKKAKFSKGQSWRNVFVTILNICEEAWVYIFHFRKLLLCLPVVIGSVYLARVNWTLLPEQVGINLQATGEFAMMISREMAVTGPLVVTAACLVLMFGCRKALYPWAVSIFTLVLPILLLLSNIYPA